MNNNAWTYFAVAALTMLAMAIVGNQFISPEKRSVNPGLDRVGITKSLTIVNVPIDNPESNQAHDIYLIGIFGAALLIGCLAGFFFRGRPQSDVKNPSSSTDLLSSISSDTGINEYELFRRAAENWGVSEARIAEDFRNYMAGQRLPYYVTDYARKNRFRTEILIQDKKQQPSSWSDWAKALLVFPGSFVFLYVALVLLP